MSRRRQFGRALLHDPRREVIPLGGENGFFADRELIFIDPHEGEIAAAVTEKATIDCFEGPCPCENAFGFSAPA
jgi:hypothetical protein